MNRIKGILYAAASSSTFGLAPFFSITLLLAGFSSFEVLSYRWGVAAITLTIIGMLSGCNFRLDRRDFYCRVLFKFISGCHFFQLDCRLSEYCEWSCIYYSFYVSVGCCVSDDVLFWGEEIYLGDYCCFDVTVWSINAFFRRAEC